METEALERARIHRGTRPRQPWQYTLMHFMCLYCCQVQRRVAHLIGEGRRAVILVVEVASHLEVAAFGGGHPQVGASRVEYHLEGLGRSADAHDAVVLRSRRRP